MTIRFREQLLGIYRSYRKGLECVYAESGKLLLQLAGQPDLWPKWQPQSGRFGDQDQPNYQVVKY
jgi:hypothetical protein